MIYRVSVVMPVFDVGTFVKEAIESILNQSYTNFEFIIIDDASSDNTVEVIKTFKDERIKLVTNEVNKGLAANLNAAIKMAKGEYILRMDGDDISLPDRIKTQVEYMDNNPGVGISGSYIKLFGYASTSNYYPLTDQGCKCRLLFDVPFAHPTVIFRTDLFEEKNLQYSESLNQYGEDYDLWTRAAKFTKFGNIPNILLLYRTFPSQKKQLAEEKRALKGKDLREKNINNLGYTLSEIEKECLHVFAKREPINNPEISLKDIEEFVLRLENFITEKSTYDSFELKSIIGLFWFFLCYNQKKMWGIKAYCQSPLREYYSPSPFLLTKFIVKQLF